MRKFTPLALAATAVALLAGCNSTPPAAPTGPMSFFISSTGSGKGADLGGLAGAVQVLGVYHRLLPSISSGYGYTALLVGMMASFRILPVPFICLFFAVLNVGSIQLPLQLNLDSSLSGVIQGLMVLSVFVTQGLRAWLIRRREGC